MSFWFPQCSEYFKSFQISLKNSARYLNSILRGRYCLEHLRPVSECQGSSQFQALQSIPALCYNVPRKRVGHTQRSWVLPGEGDVGLAGIWGRKQWIRGLWLCLLFKQINIKVKKSQSRLTIDDKGKSIFIIYFKKMSILNSDRMKIDDLSH